MRPWLAAVGGLYRVAVEAFEVVDVGVEIPESLPGIVRQAQVDDGY